MVYCQGIKILLVITFLTSLSQTIAQTEHATWINIWRSSSVSTYDDISVHGLKVPRSDLQEGWGAIDWNNATWRQWAYSGMSLAGVDFVITDNTNGYISKTELIFAEMASTGMKLCIAFSDGELESTSLLNRALLMAGKSHYYKIDGKPVLVCYVGKEQWDNTYKDTKNPLLLQFYRVWASGEESGADKWGWQLEPQDGPINGDFMFVTPSVKHIGSQNVVESVWGGSVAMLDYSFSKAISNKPKVIIAGSFDDLWERNGWLPINTEGAVTDGNGKYTPVTGTQIFSPITGGVADPYYFYNRVTQWIRNGYPDVLTGGSIADGIYRIKNRGTGDYMQTNSDYDINSVKGGVISTQTYDKFILYHIGNNEYRIANVYSGWPIMVVNGMVVSKVWDAGSYGIIQLETTTDIDISSWDFELIQHFGEGKQGGSLKMKIKESGELLMMDMDMVKVAGEVLSKKYYAITNRNSDFGLRPANMSQSSEIIVSSESIDNDMMQWEKVDNSDGTYTLKNRATGYFLSSYGTTEGDAVYLDVITTDADKTIWSSTSTTDGFQHIVNKKTALWFRQNHLGGNGSAIQVSTATGNWTHWKFVEVVPTAIDETLSIFSENIKLYPNPAKDFLLVELPICSDKTSVSLYNMNGRLVFQKDKVTYSLIIPTANNPKGMYVLVITSNTDCYTRKVLLE